jgi:O-antigen/teichoic acid export membrane protein
MIALPLAVGVTLLADKIMLALFGPEFVEGAPALRILIWAAGFTFLGPTIGKAIIGAGEEKLSAVYCGIAMAINLALNVLLIPSLAHVGSAISILAAEGVTAGLVLMWTYQRGMLKVPAADIIRLVAATLVMGAFTYLLRRFNLWLLVSASGVVYFLSLVLLNGFSKEDRLALRRIVSR